MAVLLPVPPSGKAYSFSCPQCDAQLHSALPERLTAVECDACAFVFLAQRPIKKGTKATKKKPKRKVASSSLSHRDSSSADGRSVDSHSTAVTVGSSNWSFGAQSTPLSLALIERNDDTSSEAIISAFESDSLFVAKARKDMEEILMREAQEREKVAAGIALAVAKGMIPAHAPSRKFKKIDGLGKSADGVASEILTHLGAAPQSGCIIVIHGLPGAGKGTTASKLQTLLPRVTYWRMGHLFRALALLALSYCEDHGLPFGAEALTPSLLSALMGCFEFGKFNGKYDVRICGHGFDFLISEVIESKLKEARIEENIPAVVKMTQGEVIKFSIAAAEAMRVDGVNVLMEGRGETLSYVDTPHRFELVLSDSVVLGMRCAAQRMLGATLKQLGKLEMSHTSSTVNKESSAQMVLNVLRTELSAMGLTD